MNHIRAIISVILISYTMSINKKSKKNQFLSASSFQGVPGGQVYATGSLIKVEILSKSGTLPSNLVLFSNTLMPPQTIASTSSVGYSAVISPLPTSELIFGITIIGTSQVFKMGPASRNPDNIIHAKTFQESARAIQVGFDETNGKEDNYDDVVIRLSGGVSPVLCNRVTNQTECLNEPACLWNSYSCNDICPNRMSFFCGIDSACVMENNVCEDACERRTTLSACSVGNLCQWNNKTSSCWKVCSGYKTNGGCTQSGLCAWTGATCANACDRRIPDATCTSDGLCFIDGSNCVDECNRRNSTAFCTSEDHCIWKSPNGPCSHRCSDRNNGNCASDGECIWTGTTCIDSCHRRPADNTCTSDSRCFIENGMCLEECSRRSNQTICLASDGCLWDSSKNVCSHQCSDRALNKDSCAGDGQCYWVNNTCIDLCSRRPANSHCNNDGLCFVSGSSCLDECDRRLDEPTCTSVSQCIWDNKTSVCSHECSYRSVDDCANDGQCLWAGKGCVAICSRRTLSNCGTGGVCFMNGKDCIDECDRRTDQQTCSAVSQCKWEIHHTPKPTGQDLSSPNNSNNSTTNNSTSDSNNTITTYSCFHLCPDRTISACEADTQCILYNSTTTNSTCVDACSRRPSNGTCSVDGLCLLSNNSCVKECDRRTSSSECTSSPECIWDGTSKCSRRCSDRNNNTCQADDMCMWNNGTCVDDCLRRKADSTCAKDGACFISNNNCVYECNKMTSDTGCKQISGCMWNNEVGPCTHVCSGRYSNKTCQSDNMCKWNSTSSNCTDVKSNSTTATTTNHTS